MTRAELDAQLKEMQDEAAHSSTATGSTKAMDVDTGPSNQAGDWAKEDIALHPC